MEQQIDVEAFLEPWKVPPSEVWHRAAVPPDAAIRIKFPGLVDRPDSMTVSLVYRDLAGQRYGSDLKIELIKPAHEPLSLGHYQFSSVVLRTRFYGEVGSLWQFLAEKRRRRTRWGFFLDPD